MLFIEPSISNSQESSLPDKNQESRVTADALVTFMNKITAWFLPKFTGKVLGEVLPAQAHTCVPDRSVLPQTPALESLLSLNLWLL